MLNLKQFNNEGLLEYVKILKQARDIMKSHVGTDILDRFIENTREYRDESDAVLQQIMKNISFDKWMAYLLLRNSDQGKYGSLMNGLVSQFSMQNNQYPKTIYNATDILSNHKHDNWKDQKKKWQQPKKGDDNAATDVKDKIRRRRQASLKVAIRTRTRLVIAAERRDM